MLVRLYRHRHNGALLLMKLFSAWFPSTEDNLAIIEYASLKYFDSLSLFCTWFLLVFTDISNYWKIPFKAKFNLLSYLWILKKLFESLHKKFFYRFQENNKNLDLCTMFGICFCCQIFRIIFTIALGFGIEIVRYLAPQK
jgi:hypothetical protein